MRPKFVLYFAILLITLLACQPEEQQPEDEILISDNSGGNLCLLGCPVGARQDNILVDHKIFILSSNIETKYADWVAYKVIPENLQGESIARAWKKDPNIPKEYTLIPIDYKDAARACSYDRGHQAPLADFKGSEDAFKTNYLSNITPQKSDLNRGAWKNLESKIRKLTENNDEIYVLTGPYYNGETMCDLPFARIRNQVPNGYWVIAAIVRRDGIHTASFTFSQSTIKGENFCSHIVALQQIEDLTHLQFFPKKYIMPIDETSLSEEICFN